MGWLKGTAHMEALSNRLLLMIRNACPKHKHLLCNIAIGWRNLIFSPWPANKWKQAKQNRKCTFVVLFAVTFVFVFFMNKFLQPSYDSDYLYVLSLLMGHWLLINCKYRLVDTFFYFVAFVNCFTLNQGKTIQEWNVRIYSLWKRRKQKEPKTKNYKSTFPVLFSLFPFVCWRENRNFVIQ